ncbi:MAG: hypothetical protein DRJ01_00495 [Bacteroidetes bacterium]|nr:MAG: hypothetical protein DRJ01_00495 [Bacteroidota bacterium]
MKKCSFCKKEKPLEDFGKLSSSKDGLNSACKICRKEINIKSYEKVGRKQNTDKQKEAIKNYKAKWFQDNKKRIRENILTDEQKVKVKKYKADWFQENKKRLNKINLMRRKTEPKVKINHLMSGAILKCLGRDKNGNKWTEIVGYTAEDLLNHFEVDVIPKGYHIDHIIPINAYDYSSIDDEFLKCWNIRNLRIIPAKENLSKGDKLDKKMIIEHNIIDLLPKEVVFEGLDF